MPLIVLTTTQEQRRTHTASCHRPPPSCSDHAAPSPQPVCGNTGHLSAPESRCVPSALWASGSRLCLVGQQSHGLSFKSPKPSPSEARCWSWYEPSVLPVTLREGSPAFSNLTQSFEARESSPHTLSPFAVEEMAPG